MSREPVAAGAGAGRGGSDGGGSTPSAMTCAHHRAPRGASDAGGSPSLAAVVVPLIVVSSILKLRACVIRNEAFKEALLMRWIIGVAPPIPTPPLVMTF